MYELLGMLSKTGGTFSEMVRYHATGELLEYDPIYRGESDWKLLPPIDVPGEPQRCMVSGTGLTHEDGALRSVDLLPEHKEAGFNVVPSQAIDYPWCGLRVRPIIEGERNPFAFVRSGLWSRRPSAWQQVRLRRFP